MYGFFFIGNFPMPTERKKTAYKKWNALILINEFRLGSTVTAVYKQCLAASNTGELERNFNGENLFRMIDICLALKDVHRRQISNFIFGNWTEIRCVCVVVVSAGSFFLWLFSLFSIHFLWAPLFFCWFRPQRKPLCCRMLWNFGAPIKND